MCSTICRSGWNSEEADLLDNSEVKTNLRISIMRSNVIRPKHNSF